MTCWDDPERCHGCHYCQDARRTDHPLWPLTPAEAHGRDLTDDLCAKGGVLIDGIWEVAK